MWTALTAFNAGASAAGSLLAHDTEFFIGVIKEVLMATDITNASPVLYLARSRRRLFRRPYRLL